MNRVVSMAALVLGLWGCGGPSCWDTGKCNGDLVSFQQSMATCGAIMDGDCGSDFKDALGYLEDHEQCDASDRGRVDTSACKSQLQTFQVCCRLDPKACPVD